MILKEDNSTEIIKSYTEQNWEPLLDLIPKIEIINKFSDESGAINSSERDIIKIDPYSEHEIIQQFLDVVYSIPIIIDFDWSSWDEGREIAGDDNFDYDSIDIPAKCKIITAIVRNDRFYEGALLIAFKSGIMLKVLKSIQKQLGSLINS
jgi:hypothetical protein